jgi:hydroxyacylglutathione hydrolase
MKIERFEIAGLAQYSYVISDDGKAVIIDPIRDIDRYTIYAAQQGLQITYVLETHIHADFAAGSTALGAATGAELALSAYDAGEHYRYAMAHRALRDGDAIEAGSVRIQALHTPGHTPEHLSFLVFDGERSATTPVALFSGDFLFVGSLGRPDLLGEAAKVGLAHELYRSLHERIRALPDSVAIYPGHGAGSLCGAGMSDRAESTLGYERVTNHLFQLTEEDFVAEIVGSVPPMPRYYPRMKEMNAQGAPVLADLPGGKALSVAEVKSLAGRGDTIVLDVRGPEAFGGAHINGAIHIGAGQNLSLWAGWLLDADKRLVLVGDAGDDEAARRALLRVGLDGVEGFLAKGMPAWIDAGLEFARTTQVSTQEVFERAREWMVCDVRSDQEWEGGHIEGATHIMLGELAGRMGELAKDRPIVAVCGSGYRSSIAASLLAQRGFCDVRSMAGGMGAWQRQDLPLSEPALV